MTRPHQPQGLVNQGTDAGKGGEGCSGLERPWVWVLGKKFSYPAAQYLYNSLMRGPSGAGLDHAESDPGWDGGETSLRLLGLRGREDGWRGREGSGCPSALWFRVKIPLLGSVQTPKFTVRRQSGRVTLGEARSRAQWPTLGLVLVPGASLLALLALPTSGGHILPTPGTPVFCPHILLHKWPNILKEAPPPSFIPSDSVGRKRLCPSS